MIHIAKLIESKTGKYLMSILLGFGLASMFRVACKGSRCKIYNAPPDLMDIDDRIYKYNGKCYQMKQEHMTCDYHKLAIQI